MGIDGWVGPTDILQGWENECHKAATDSDTFERFRQLPNIKCVTENKLPEWVDSIVDCIHAIDSNLLVRMIPTLTRIDKIGSPTLHKTKYGYFSPTTLGHLSILGGIQSCFGSLEGLHIAEIGGGYGSLAAMITEFNPKSYTLYDLPEVQALQSKFLNTVCPTHNVVFCSLDDQTINTYDLVISASAFSEFNEELRSDYATKILSKTQRGWIAWSFPGEPELSPEWLSEPSEILSWIHTNVNSDCSYAKLIPEYKTPWRDWEFFWGDNFGGKT